MIIDSCHIKNELQSSLLTPLILKQQKHIEKKKHFLFCANVINIIHSGANFDFMKTNI